MRNEPTSVSQRGVVTLGGAARGISAFAVAVRATLALACGVGEDSTTEAPVGATTGSDTTSTDVPSSGSTFPVAERVLHSTGIGAVRFGEPTDSALPLLVTELGRQPTDDSNNLDAMSQGYGGTTVRSVQHSRVSLESSGPTRRGVELGDRPRRRGQIKLLGAGDRVDERLGFCCDDPRRRRQEVILARQRDHPGRRPSLGEPLDVRRW